MKVYLTACMLLLILASPLWSAADTNNIPATTASTDIPQLQDPLQVIPNEISKLDNIIAATKDCLNAQIAVRHQVVEYQKLQENYLQNPDNKEQLFYLVKTANKLQESIKQHHLTHNFSSEFLNELALFAQIGSKRGIPKAS